MRFILIILLFFILFPPITYARVTPEDIINSQRQEYQARVKNYSAQNQQSLENLQKRLAQVNSKRSLELDQNMVLQGLILEEYQSRHPKDTKIEDTRYWVTFAHEAVAYQQAKIYIPDLSSESAIKSDIGRVINLFKSDLNSTRAKVIKSQKLLQDLVKE